MTNPIISPLTPADREAAYHVFEASIPDAIHKEGAGRFTALIEPEIAHKKQLLDASLDEPDAGVFFLIAKVDQRIVGTISYGPLSDTTRALTQHQLDGVGELGSLYILPEYQNHGVGSALIHAMMVKLREQGIERFCLESGYPRAQQRWLRKFGEPYLRERDFWGEGLDHLIWQCATVDFV